MSYLTDIEIGLHQLGGFRRSSRQMHREAGSDVPWKTVGLRFSVMEFGDEANYVKTEAEMGPIVIGVAAARLPQRLKQLVANRR